MRVSVIIPAYNEGSRMAATLKNLIDYFSNAPYEWELIVVDDGSTDETSKVAAKVLEGTEHKVITNKTNMGKGHAVRSGMLSASGDVVLFIDADLSTPIYELERFLPLITAGCDVVIGSRALDDSNITIRQNPVRETMGRVFNLLVRLIVIGDYRDTQCGFKCFSAKAARKLFKDLKTRGFAFDVELLLRAKKLDLRVAEVGVEWRDSKDSSVRIIKGSVGMFLELLRIKYLCVSGKI